MFNISDSDGDNSSSEDEGQSTSSTSAKAKFSSSLHNNNKINRTHKKHSDDSDQSNSEEVDDDEEEDDDDEDGEYDKENKVMRCGSRKQLANDMKRGPISKLVVLNKQQLSNENLSPTKPRQPKLSELHPKPDPSHLPQFSRSSVGGSKYLLTCHPNPAPEIEDLVFESRFESGNLAKAVKITSGYYELYLRPDMYTNRHTQWFYFRVSNTRKNVNYR